MHTTAGESNVYTQLRDRAEAQLQSGTLLTTGHWSMGVEALHLLHRLSSNPDNAEDALKLLHELQVHQVELDLQNEEMVANEQALAEDLRLYRALYDYAPFGYFVINMEGAVIQGNPAAAELLGVAHEELEGHPLDTFLNRQHRPQLQSLLQRVVQTGARDFCVVGIGEGGSRHLQILATRSPEGEHILLTICELASAE